MENICSTITFFDFRYFDSVDVCKVRPDWRETRLRGIFPFHAKEPPKVVKVTVFYTTEIEVGLFQEGIRYAFSYETVT